MLYYMSAFIGAVASVIYAFKKYYVKESVPRTRRITSEFKPIGVVKQIFVYPLDGGPGREVQVAHCYPSGLIGDSLEDRAYMAYTEVNRAAILNVNYPELVVQDIKKILRKIVDMYRPPQHQEVEINYLGATMTVIDQGDDIAKVAHESLVSNLVRHVRIGYCSPQNREDFNDNRIVRFDRRFAQVVDNYSPYFATYTLVNQESINYLEKQTGATISPMDFRANVVIEGPAFCEDKIFSLNIGKIPFYDAQPCTHTPSAFIRRSDIENPENLQPYKYLEQNRSRSSVRPEFGNMRFPMFGINLSLIRTTQPAIIRVGDPVEATMYCNL